MWQTDSRSPGPYGSVRCLPFCMAERVSHHPRPQLMVGIFGYLDAGLLDADVIQAVPLEEHLPGLDVYLLGDPFPGSCGPRGRRSGRDPFAPGVGRQERGVLKGDEELVQVPPVTVAAEPGRPPQ